MQELLIEAGRTERQYWRDLWRYRELFYFLAWRDLLVRYKQTVVGTAWVVLRPALTTAVLAFVFGRLAAMPSGGTPYPVLVLCGLLPWQLFSTAVSESGNSLVANTSLVSKVYFPRMAVPASSVLTSLVDFSVGFILLALLMIWYGQVPGSRALALPVFVLLALAAACGIGVWCAALTVRYRDVRFVLPFLTQFGLYVSPVGFSSDVVPQQWRLLYSLNPVVGVIDGFRWSLLGGTTSLFWPGLLVSTATVVVLLGSGLRYFRATERTFADVI